MPIRPENRDRYPRNWPEISARIRNERAGGRCEGCGVANGAIGGRDETGAWWPATKRENHPLVDWPAPGEHWWCERDGRSRWLRIVRIVLTCAHLDHTPENCADENLRAWCQRCHNVYDGPERRRGIAERERAKRAMGELPGLPA